MLQVNFCWHSSLQWPYLFYLWDLFPGSPLSLSGGVFQKRNIVCICLKRSVHCLHPAPEVFQWVKHLWCSTPLPLRNKLHGGLKTTVFRSSVVWVILELMNSCPCRHWGALKVFEDMLVSTDHHFCPPFSVYLWAGVGSTAIEAPGWWNRDVFLIGEEFHRICSFCC